MDAGLMEKGDWPNYVDTIRPVYEPEELVAMFKAATEDEATLLKFVLGSGFRDQEIRYVEWKDIDFRNQDVAIEGETALALHAEELGGARSPAAIRFDRTTEKRKEARKATPNQLVFPNGRGKPDSEMDMVVKRVAERAGLNCKQCVTEHNNKCAEGPYCMNFFLHKFRHTFATNHLRDGVDIRTVQSWLGHRDIKSTMVYLKGHPVERTPRRRSTAASWRHWSPESRLEWKKPPLLVAFSNFRRFGDVRAAVTPKPMMCRKKGVSATSIAPDFKPTDPPNYAAFDASGKFAASRCGLFLVACDWSPYFRRNQFATSWGSKRTAPPTRKLGS
jgi:hypothetical protein